MNMRLADLIFYNFCIFYTVFANNNNNNNNNNQHGGRQINLLNNQNNRHTNGGGLGNQNGGLENLRNRNNNNNNEEFYQRGNNRVTRKLMIGENSHFPHLDETELRFDAKMLPQIRHQESRALKNRLLDSNNNDNNNRGIEGANRETNEGGVMSEDYGYMNYDENEENTGEGDEEEGEDDGMNEEIDDDEDYDEYDSTDDDNIDSLQNINYDEEHTQSKQQQSMKQHEHQAEEPYKGVSTLTKEKWDRYGTRQSVQDSWRAYQLSQQPPPPLPSSQQQSHQTQQNTRASNTDSINQRISSEVIAHFMRMKHEGQCRKPSPKIIYVQSEHPDPTRTYTPHCTILYRCAEDTGCCANYQKRCGVKTETTVQLYFYIKILGKTEFKVEKLSFSNHTECECVERTTDDALNVLRDDYDQPSAPITSQRRSILSSNYFQHQNPHYQHNQNIGYMYHHHHNSYQQNHALINQMCKCPGEFVPKYRYNSHCTCDCEGHNLGCARMKKGKEFFSMNDRLCILEGQCGHIQCEYGVYLREKGRCQRKQEKIDAFSKITNVTNVF